MAYEETMFQLIGAAVGGLVIGGVCGVPALLTGILRGKAWMGLVSLAVCLIFGLLMTTVAHQPAFLTIFVSAVLAVGILLLTRRRVG